MSKKGTHWTPTEVKELRFMAKRGFHTHDIAKSLQRTVPAVYNKASDKNITLKPKDKS